MFSTFILRLKVSIYPSFSYILTEPNGTEVGAGGGLSRKIALWQFCTKSDIFLIFFKNGKNIQIDYKYFIVYSYFPSVISSNAYTDLVETVNTG